MKTRSAAVENEHPSYNNIVKVGSRPKGTPGQRSLFPLRIIQ